MNDRAFLTSARDVHRLSRGRLRGRDLQHPFHGVRAIGLDPDSPVDRCRAYLPLMASGRYFSHASAAALFGMPLPLRLESDPCVHVSVLDGGTRPRGRGVRGHELIDTTVLVRMLGQFPVIGPADTWYHLASMLTPTDLIAVGDFLISGVRTRTGRTPALCDRESLVTAGERHRGQRGAAGARRLIGELRSPVDSRRESILRRLLVDNGLPEPLVSDPTPVDRGTAILHPDLKWPQWRIVLEYEGDDHRELRRFRADIRRRERFEAAGWRVIRVVADDLVRIREFLERVRDHIAQQLRILR